MFRNEIIKKLQILILVTSVIVSGLCSAKDEPTLRIIDETKLPSEELLRNGNFEDAGDWDFYKSGFDYDNSISRGGKQSAKCVNLDTKDHRGAAQVVVLNQEKPNKIIASGWSKAENVSGTSDVNYSIYLDLTYQDGTPLWGQIASFSISTHDWEYQQVIVNPEKPVKQLTIYGLFRNHTGTVWFDDFSLKEIEVEKAVSFDDVLVEKDFSFKKIHSIPLSDNEEGYWLIRDVAKNSNFYTAPWPKGKIEELNLEINGKIEKRADAQEINLEIHDTTGTDRAFSLIFILPLKNKETPVRWWDDARSSQLTENGKEYRFTSPVGDIGSGQISRYPISSITIEEVPAKNYSLAIRMDRPFLYRLSYNPDFRWLYVAYDIGLAPDTKRPGTGSVTVVAYPSNPEWGFRSALKRYYELYPEFFVKRVPREGIWMPFTDIKKVQGFEDFGFMFQEGAPNISFDDTHGFLSFPYNEPASWWMPMGKKERNYEGLLQALKEYAENPANKFHHNMSHAVYSCGTYDRDGKYNASIKKAPWCDGAVFALNPDPDLPSDTPGFKNRAYLGYDPKVADKKYKPNSFEGIDGEYLDSLEMFSGVLNFRREHFKYSDMPIVFTKSDKKVAQMMIFNTYKFTRWVAEDVHKRRKLMFANAVPHQFSFLCHLLDIMGVERNWNPGGKYTPDSDWLFNYRRAMCYQKPYLILQNTLYDNFGPELVEKYFQRCLFYAVYPSMFSHNAAENPYWANPNWYNRDRHLFVKYIPLIKKLSVAGWEPIPYASVEPEMVFLERYGPNSEGEIFFALLNNSNEEQKATLNFEIAPFGLKDVPSSAEELIEKISYKVKKIPKGGEVQIIIPAESTRILRLK